MKARSGGSKTTDRDILSDKLVVEKTGKDCEHWFAELDRLGAKKLNKTMIYELTVSLKELKPLGEWNCGLLSTKYAWSRGLVKRGEKANGFEISVGKTVAVPLPVLFKSFLDAGRGQSSWLKEKISITKSTDNKSVRGTTSSGTRLSVDFYDKGAGKSQVVVQEMKIPDEKEAEERKAFWKSALDGLHEALGR